ncbi:MAG: RNA polymerase sigma factor FliA [Gammaproteobacteria bacterium]
MNELAAQRDPASVWEDGDYAANLVVRYTALVKRIAHHLISRLPRSVQLDDLVQAGMIGLLEAARNYDPAQGASFETYSGIRIRGSMLDEIRKGDWAPRSLHRKTRELAKAVREIEAEQGRDARDSEVAERLGLSLNVYYQVLNDASAHKMFSFDDVPSMIDGTSEGLTQRLSVPHEDIEKLRFQEHLVEAIAGLPERERIIMSLYYDDELNLREIGEVLGVSESRICQIHAQALVRLRARMDEWIKD